jgi:hypothetical protein
MRRWSLKASLFLCRCRGAAKSRGKTPEPKGKFILDKRTNRLLIRDNQTVVDTLQRWAAQMDIPVEQVELAAHIVTINEKACVSWGEVESRRRYRRGQGWTAHHAWQRSFRRQRHQPRGF